MIDEKVNNKEFRKLDTKVETYESIAELKFPQESEKCGIIILDDLSEKKMNNPRVQAMFKRSSLRFFLITQDSYELPKRSIRANGNIYQIFKPNNVRDVRNLYQEKASMDMTLD